MYMRTCVLRVYVVYVCVHLASARPFLSTSFFFYHSYSHFFNACVGISSSWAHQMQSTAIATFPPARRVRFIIRRLFARAYIHTCIHPYMHTHIHVCIHMSTCIHACNVCTHVCTNACIYGYQHVWRTLYLMALMRSKARQNGASETRPTGDALPSANLWV